MVASEVDLGDWLSVLKADLLSDEGWEEAVGGCDYVLHVASPFPPTEPKDADELIVPAREGTLRVLRVALAAGARRVVVTSSSGTVSANRDGKSAGRPLTEDDWTDPSSPQTRAYVRSKVLAERAAWELARADGAEDRLSVVLPGAILGPVLGPDLSYSVQAVERMLNGPMPGIPHLGFAFVDVRDVADLHLRAMTAPEAAGERHLGTGPFLWLADIARILRERLGPAARKVPRRQVPSLVVRAASIFDPSLRQVVRGLDQEYSFSTEKARTRLGWSPRPIEDTVVDCAQSLIRHGVVKPA